MNTSTKALQARPLSISLTVKDLDKSLAWHTELLGFTIERTYERGGRVGGYARHGALRREVAFRTRVHSLPLSGRFERDNLEPAGRPTPMEIST